MHISRLVPNVAATDLHCTVDVCVQEHVCTTQIAFHALGSAMQAQQLELQVAAMQQQMEAMCQSLAEVRAELDRTKSTSPTCTMCQVSTPETLHCWDRTKPSMSLTCTRCQVSSAWEHINLRAMRMRCILIV